MDMPLKLATSSPQSLAKHQEGAHQSMATQDKATHNSVASKIQVEGKAAKVLDHKCPLDYLDILISFQGLWGLGKASTSTIMLINSRYFFGHAWPL